MRKKACDSCRQKKRKCDGQTPCSYCVKTAHLNPTKLPNCTYNKLQSTSNTKPATPTTPPYEDTNYNYKLVDSKSPISNILPLSMELDLIRLGVLLNPLLVTHLDDLLCIYRDFKISNVLHLSMCVAPQITKETISRSYITAAKAILDDISPSITLGVDYCLDLVRSYIIIGVCQFGFHEVDAALECMFTLQELIPKLGIFEGIFDEQNSMLESDRLRRQLLWQSCLLIDTLGSNASGQDFFLDDNLFDWRIQPSISYFVGISKENLRPMNHLNRIRHSLWTDEKAIHFLNGMCDIGFVSVENDLHYLSQSRFAIIKSFRRVLLFARAYDKGLAEHIDYHSLHSELLTWMKDLPAALKPVSKLEIYATTIPSLESPNDVWARHPTAVQDYLLFLSGLVHLHLPGVQANSQIPYSLDLNNATQFNSKEIVLTCFNVLIYIIETMYAFSDNKFPNAPGKLTPTMSDMMSVLHIYSITSTAIIASRCFPTSQSEISTVQTLTEIYILPFLKSIGTIWPMSEHYYVKISAFIKLDPDFGMEES
ncbi:hypothetical protein HK103_006134 [Boothiomyces macroporosus]|uniref:Zn(2)-C6 fungal-type domain-containing protein n=1 Tax=Boothiomyces macroporosus TaxID=261099 RepID=A0AAD5UIC9_9FUNG|nr:hypothetical protein HK103_006134 [Boothiomyces macroporosus]